VELRDRYRQNWAAGRRSARTWTLTAVVFLIYIAVGIWLARSDINIFVRLFGGLLALVSLVPGAVALRQAVRVRHWPKP
jgi:hypothetical protein